MDSDNRIYQEIMGRLAAPSVEQLQAEVDRLEAERRWIPVSERLPGIGQSVVVYSGRYTGNPKHDIAYLSAQEIWVQDRGHFALQLVTHWRPLPDPPREAAQ